MTGFPASAARGPARALAVLLGLFVGACAAQEPEPEPAPRPPVFLIVIDCLRADHIGAYGYEQNTTPHLDSLAAESVLFEHTIAQSNWTKPSMASLLTGTYVSQHGLREGRLAGRTVAGPDELEGHTLSGSLTTWAEALRELGYRTAGFVNQGHLADYMGFDQGFDEYRFDLADAEIPPALDAWLASDDAAPPFAFLHFLDLHFPWHPPEHVDRFFAGEERPMRELMRNDTGVIRERAAAGELSPTDIAELRALYDGEVVVVDDHVRRSLAVLREAGLYEDALIVVTADHGEMLLEHGALEHGGDMIFEDVLHIPWILKLPGSERGGERVPGTVQMADIFPTVLGRLDAEAPTGIGGRDAFARSTAAEWPVLAETSDLEGPRALYLDGLKFVFAPDGEVQVFDPRADPLETTDLVDTVAADTLASAARTLASIRTDNESFERQLVQESANLRPEQIEKLRALGYIQ